MPEIDIIEIEVVETPVVVEISEVGVAADAAEVSKALTYNPDGTLATITSIDGTKTFTYSGGRLVGITGTGKYPSKSLTYTGENLTAVTIL